jgi:hypothetical protein
MRIASHGHASTHIPQYTHCKMSMSKRIGYFSTPSWPVSAPVISMQLAGHAVAQQLHATHRGVPSGQRLRLLRPLVRDADAITAQVRERPDKVCNGDPQPAKDFAEVGSFPDRAGLVESGGDDACGHGVGIDGLRRPLITVA